MPKHVNGQRYICQFYWKDSLKWQDFIFVDIKYISMKYIVHQKLLFSKVLLLFLFTQTKSVLCSHSGLFSSFFSLLSFLLTKKSFQKVWKRRRTHIVMNEELYCCYYCFFNSCISWISKLNSLCIQNIAWSKY